MEKSGFAQQMCDRRHDNSLCKHESDEATKAPSKEHIVSPSLETGKLIEVNYKTSNKN